MTMVICLFRIVLSFLSKQPKMCKCILELAKTRSFLEKKLLLRFTKVYSESFYSHEISELVDTSTLQHYNCILALSDISRAVIPPPR